MKPQQPSVISAEKVLSPASSMTNLGDKKNDNLMVFKSLLLKKAFLFFLLT